MSAWRYFATRLNGDGTETPLANDLPLSGPVITKALTGPDCFTANIDPEVLSLKAPDGSPVFTPWSTALYAEADGEIRCGTILTDRVTHGNKLGLEAYGFAGYPSGQAYTRETWFKNVEYTQIVRHIWDHLQSHPRGNIGVTLDLQPTPVRTGVADPGDAQPRDAKGRFIDDDRPKALILSWETTHDLGDSITDLAKAAPFDFVESHHWQGDKIIHKITSRYPYIGRRRDDLRFMVGENVTVVPQGVIEGDDYASEVIVVGAGEGDLTVRTVHPRPGETRLRRAVAVSDKGITSINQAAHVARLEVAARTGQPYVSEIAVMDHPNAPTGSIQLGDQILLQTGPFGWQGDFSAWMRVTEMTITPEQLGVTVLKVVPMS